MSDYPNLRASDGFAAILGTSPLQRAITSEARAALAEIEELRKDRRMHERVLMDLAKLCGRTEVTTHGLDYTTILGAKIERLRAELTERKAAAEHEHGRCHHCGTMVYGHSGVATIREGEVDRTYHPICRVIERAERAEAEIERLRAIVAVAERVRAAWTPRHSVGSPLPRDSQVPRCVVELILALTDTRETLCYPFHPRECDDPRCTCHAERAAAEAARKGE